MQIGSVSSTKSYTTGQADGAGASEDFKAAAAFANVLANAFGGSHRSRADARPEMKGPEAAAPQERSRPQDYDNRQDYDRRPERQADAAGEKRHAERPKTQDTRSSDKPVQDAPAAEAADDSAAQSAASQQDQAAEAAGKAGEQPANDEAKDKEKKAAEAATDQNLILNLFIPAAQAAASAGNAGAASQNGTQNGAQAGVAVDAAQQNAADAALQQMQASVLSPEAQKQILDAMRQSQAGKTGVKLEMQAAGDGTAPKPLVDPAALFADMLAQQGADGAALDGQGAEGQALLGQQVAEQQMLKQEALAMLSGQAAAGGFTLEGEASASPAAEAAKGGIAGIGQAQPGQQTQATGHVQAQAARHAAALVPPGEQVAVHVKKAIAEGSDTISIKLDPGNLGRVEVTLEVSQDGRLLAVIAADKPETLQMLQKDAAALEQSLRDSGLKTNQDSLNFQLRDQGQDNRGFAGSEGGRRGYGRDSDDYGDGAVSAGDARSLAAAANAQRAAARGGLDIRI